MYRLTQANHPLLDNEDYQYDGVHNRIQRTLTPLSESAVTDNWQYNNDNQLVSYSSVNDFYQFTYDANGNTIKRSHCSDSEFQNCSFRFYSYDARERLVKIEDQIKEAGLLGNKQAVAEYGYNQLGQRIWKNVSGKTTFFLFDQTGLVAEYDANFKLNNEYGYTPNSTFMTNPLFSRTIDNSAGINRIDFYFNDHLGTPLKLFSKVGSIVWSANASAFGEAHINQESITNNLRYPGQYFDQETGTHYNYYRDYNAELGRYLQSDPIGLGGGINRYSYVYSNSTGNMDVYGLWAWAWGTYTGGNVITPGGGVLGGVNGQFFSDGSSGAFGVAGVGWGWDVGAGGELNFAVHTGDGGVDSWSGRFDAIAISAAGYTMSIFWGGGWYGVSGGVASDGLAASYQITEYVPLAGSNNALFSGASCTVN